MAAMMKCGHAANGTKGDKPVCVICYGISEGADVVDDAPPSLEGRKSKCSDCGRWAHSSNELPFFEYKPTQEYDRHYCGCRGWD